MKQIILWIAVCFCTHSLWAKDVKPGVVFDLGGKFDKSFNETVAKGINRFTEKTGIKVLEFEPHSEPQFEQVLRKMARRGRDPILAVGFSQKHALSSVAKQFPNTRFAIIDAVVDLPNVKSILFKGQDGSFLVGYLAAMASKTGKIGFIGGQDSGLTRRFACGYSQGAKHRNLDIVIYQNMVGSTGAAWNNPGRGLELAKSQFDRGADVVYAAAGISGIGVYQAAKDNNKMAIGVDSNQNHLHPGHMLTSMLKRVDIAAFSTFDSAQRNLWQPGIEMLGLSEKGIDWALDEHNAPLITQDMKDHMQRIKQEIIQNKIKVHNYEDDNSCNV